MEKTPIISINLDVKCKRCGQKGVMQNGLCLKCFTKAIKNGELDHILKKHKPVIPPPEGKK